MTGKSRAVHSCFVPSSPQQSAENVCNTLNCLSISHSIVLSLVRYLYSTLVWRGQSTVFWWRSVALDFEVLNLILTTSHSNTNHTSACWKSRSHSSQIFPLSNLQLHRGGSYGLRGKLMNTSVLRPALTCLSPWATLARQWSSPM